MTQSPTPESQRRTQRISLALEIHYRSAGSFLVTFSVNLSRGGLFLETHTPLPTGTPIDLKIFTPDAADIDLAGVVAWVRTPAQATPGQPAGMGIAVQTPEDRYGSLVDEIASRFTGIKVLLALGPGQSKTRAVLRRHLLSTLACQIVDLEIHSGLSVSAAAFDLALVDLDDPGSAALLRALRAEARPLPVLGLGRRPEARTRAQGYDLGTLLPPLPGFPELREAVIRALVQPAAVK